MTGQGNHEEMRCLCCGKAVKEPSCVPCPACGKRFHKKCYLRDSGIERKDDTPCICCVCPAVGKTNTPRGKSGSKYADGFLKNGFCVIPLPKVVKGEPTTELLGRWNTEANRLFSGFLHAYECQATSGRSGVPSLDAGYANFRQRCEGRFEMISPTISDNAVLLVETCDDIQATLRVLLSPNRKRMSSGCFYSVHGSKNQNYHTDGPALSDVVDLFPYAINVFVPLVPVDGKNGTEFMPGTQRVIHEEEGKRVTVRPSVPLGSAILFDYRVIHRGLANSTTVPRPCYYVTYSRDWYTDKYNFSEKRYKRSLEVDPTFMETREERSRRRYGYTTPCDQNDGE